MHNAQSPLRPTDLLSADRARPVTLKKMDARVDIDEPGAPGFLPALMTPDGALEPLLAYFASVWRTRPRSWMNKVVRAAALFMRYASVQPASVGPDELLRGFTDCLYAGTLREDGRDPTGLCWQPAGDTAVAQTLGLVAGFLEFLATSGRLEPSAGDDAYARVVICCAGQWHRDKSCLLHPRLSDSRARSRSAALMGGLAPASHRRSPVFPEHCLADLLFKGFKTGSRYDYRGMLITLLLNGAGLATFEPFHLYASDVIQSPGDEEMASLYIRDPSREWLGLGNASSSDGQADSALRAEYLRMRWKGSPRRGKPGAHAAESAAFGVHWSSPDMEALFGVLWASYRRQLAATPRDHPYAFVNLRGSGRGMPYTIGQFNQMHTVACRRIGLDVARPLGSTLEGHRQAYARRLKSGGTNAQIREHLAQWSLVGLDAQDDIAIGATWFEEPVPANQRWAA